MVSGRTGGDAVGGSIGGAIAIARFAVVEAAVVGISLQGKAVWTFGNGNIRRTNDFIAIGVGNALLAAFTGNKGSMVARCTLDLRANNIAAIVAAFVNDEVTVGIVALLAFFAGGTDSGNTYRRFFGNTRGENHRAVDIGTHHAIGFGQGDHGAGNRGFTAAFVG